MSNIEKTIDRIKKLFALAERNNSPEEAASAAALAQELLFEAKLTMTDIVAEDEPEDVLCSLDFDTPGHKWKKSLVHGIAKAFYCRACRTLGGYKVRIVGKLSDVQAVSYMAAYLIGEIERLAKAESGKGKRWINSFKVGAICTIIERLNEQKKSQDEYVTTGSGEKALALRNDAVALNRYFKQLFPKTIKSGRASATSTGGFQAGQQAGRAIGLGGGKGLVAQARRLGSM